MPPSRRIADGWGPLRRRLTQPFEGGVDCNASNNGGHTKKLAGPNMDVEADTRDDDGEHNLQAIRD